VYPKVSCVKSFILSLAPLEDGGNFKRWGLDGHALQGNYETMASSMLFFFNTWSRDK
jgi:hypothetical protein